MPSPNLEGRIRFSPDEEERLVQLFEEIEQNRKWVEEHREELSRKYPDSYLAVKEKEVVGVGDNHTEMLDEVKRMYEEVPRDTYIHYTGTWGPLLLFSVPKPLLTSSLFPQS